MRGQEFMTLGNAPVIVGIVFGVQNQLIGYSFIGAGVLLPIISAFKLQMKPRTQNHRTGGV